MSTQNPVFPDRASRALRWQFSPLGWVVVAFTMLAIAAPFHTALSLMFDGWNLDPSYSHGILIPPLTLYLIWRQRAQLASLPFQASWTGPPIVLAGFGLWYLGNLSTLYVIAQYGFLVVLYGAVLSLAGIRVFRTLAMPLLLLILMVPLPAFFANSLSLRMQLLSSSLGVDLIRLFGISVFLEGNVIDLGTFKLQVVEACDGLRYLFPLMTLAFIVAYLFKASLWKRVLVFLSSCPIAILMNSFRIGVIGITVEYWGTKMAEGVLHDFEGWVVFMLSIVLLLALAAVLNRIGRPGAKLRDAIALDSGPSIAKATSTATRALSLPFFVVIGFAVCANILSVTTSEHAEIHPARATFAEFPDTLSSWHAVRSPLEQVYLDDLKLDDYLLADFHRQNAVPVNVWIAWYDSQRSGQSVHSPRSCLPGGGWELSSLTQPTVTLANGQKMAVNRALIEQGSHRELVYYWFAQRGRLVTNEYLVKWFIIYDAITRNRTDGALVRLIVPIPDGERVEDAERELVRFASTIAAELPPYLPG